MTPQDFIERWQPSAGSERANYQGFLTELAELIGAPRPEPATGDSRRDAYVFERKVKIDLPNGTSTPNYIDLYKRGCFVLEAKQGSDQKPKPDRQRPPALFSDGQAAVATRRGTAVRGTRGWDDAMLKASVQADRYCRALANDDLGGWPPFKIVVDVGHVIELYADFSRSGRTYQQFPNRDRYRIRLADLADAHEAQLITTEKDWVRLPADWRARVTAWPVTARFNAPEHLDDLLRRGVDAGRRRG